MKGPVAGVMDRRPEFRLGWPEFTPLHLDSLHWSEERDSRGQGRAGSRAAVTRKAWLRRVATRDGACCVGECPGSGHAIRNVP